MSREDHFDLVEKFGSNELKEKQIKIKSLIQNGIIQTQNPEDKALAISYAQEVKQLKNDLQNFTSDIQKFSTSYAPIPILASCLDRSSINTFSLAEIRKKSKEKPISTIRQEGKDDIMEIQGSIEKNPIRFFYNLSNPNASLQSDDHFSFDSVNKQMLIGNQERTSLNIELPTIKTIQETMEKETPPELLQQLLQNSTDKEEYFTKLNEHIQNIFEQNFRPSEEVKSRICLRTEKNLTSQVFSSEFFPPHLKNQLEDPRIINNTPELKKLFHLLDLSLEESTTDEIQTLRKGLKKLRNLTNNQDQINKIADPVLKNQLQNLHMSLQNGSSLSDWTQNMLNFFNLFIKQEITTTNNQLDSKDISEHIINPQDLEDFLNLSKHDKPLQQQEAQQQFSESFNKKYTRYQEKTQALSINSRLEELDYEIENLAFAYA